jgi:hypothetical protein
MFVRMLALMSLMLSGPLVREAGAQMPPLTTVMNEKAENAARLLRPLVTSDFVGLDSAAERLGRLTYTEVASWQARADALYLQQAASFVRAVQDLRQASLQRDAAHAGDAYRALVSSCVECHRLARAGRTVSLTMPGPSINAQRPK